MASSIAAVRPGSVAQMSCRSGLPFPWTALYYGFSEDYSERGEAVQDGHTNLELGDLTVEVPRSQTLAQEFNAMHFGLCAASAVVAAPSSPDGPTEAPRCTESFISFHHIRNNMKVPHDAG